MKARNLLIVLAGLLVMPLYFGGCAVDRWEAYAGQTQTDRWIDDTMRVWYYWKQDIPHTNDLNYFSPPFEFFASVLSEQDGKDGQPFSNCSMSLRTVLRARQGLSGATGSWKWMGSQSPKTIIRV